MKKIIAVIGNATIENDIEKQKISFEVGKQIIDCGYILATGGLGGVMEYASKGARSSENYTSNSIIGVLPDYDTDNANPYTDIHLPTGLGLGRNLILISMSDAVIAIGGGSGTLNEISSAWQMKKLIIGFETEGWSGKLCGKALDKRRNDIIYPAGTPQQLITILKEKLPIYAKNRFSGVKKARIGKDKAKEIISTFFGLANELYFLGKGSEGYIYTDYQNIYKVIDAHNEYDAQITFWILLSLSEKSKSDRQLKCIIPFDVFFKTDDNSIIVKYNYFVSKDFSEKQTDKDQFVALLKECKKIQFVTSDFQPQNLRIASENNLVVTDLGHSWMPYSEHLFKSMCRRAFVTYKLQAKFHDYDGFKKYISAVNASEDFSLMTEQGFNADELRKEFADFYDKIVSRDKKDILNPVIREIFSSHINVESVFDYGSGHGDMSSLLNDIGKSVTAYEPDRKVFEEYKNKYYKNIRCLDYTEAQKLIINEVVFDCALCSLVLCYPLAENENDRLEIMRNIINDLRALSKKYIVMVICNPLYTYQSCSLLQKRILPKNFNYQHTTEFTKKIFSSGRERSDIHRPLSFYENLFIEHKLSIKEIIQTDDDNPKNWIKNSDFMIFILEKK